MKTPCLKCGLIHDEPTAICDGYVGIDPDETASDGRKQAAARIRAILTAVPIESRRGGRARAAAAAAGASTSTTAEAPLTVASRPEPPPAEVPEWRREVSERLESYRSRRERQRAKNQSVLEFRVHSKGETLEAAPEAAAVSAVLDAPAPEPMAASPAPAEFSIAPPTLDVAKDAVAPPVATAENSIADARTYQPVEEADLTEDLNSDLTADITDLAAHVSGNGSSTHATALEDEETVRTTAAALAAAAAVEPPGEIPVASEPGVVLADSATLEVHADPVELADVQSVQPAETIAEPPAMESAPLASIPAIDTEYWRSVPAPEAEEAECGSLTSGFDTSAKSEEEEAMQEQHPALEEAAQEEPLPQEEEPELAAVAESSRIDSAEEPISTLHAESELSAIAERSESSSSLESLLPAALETGDQIESENRRAALRTAARPQSAGPPERIEIRVPQPVFDFSPNNVELQPQVEILPVADLRERRCAAFLDAVVLGLTIAGFFVAFRLAGGEFAFSRVGMAVSVAASFLIYSQYVLLFTMVGGATPGMVLRGLRVVCFDNMEPTTTELTWRAFGYVLSAAAGMLGFLWSAWDEHGLSWHDRISQTYITYAEPKGFSTVEPAH